MQQGKIIINENGRVSVSDNVQMRDFEIAELFGVFAQTIKANIRAILKSGVREGDLSNGGTVIGFSHPIFKYRLNPLFTTFFLRSALSLIFISYLCQPFNKIQIKMKVNTPSVLLIYTGGTIGMIENPETGALENFNFEHLLKYVPELKRFNYHISSIQFDPPLDSSDMEPLYWAKLVEIIYNNYNDFDGFVVLHGTDTMAYTASALSFMLENLSKPVILTGSQLPIGMLRTDGKENLITSIEIAAAKNPDGSAIVPEVCIFFENHLMRGNRTTKINSENFNAFRSFNYQPLARAGIHIKYEPSRIRIPDPDKPLKPHYLFDTNVVILTLFPGIQESIITSVLHVPGLKAVVMKTFGSGNAPQKEWFIQQLKEATDRGIIIVNITQCSSGAVEMERYETGMHLLEAGVISGYDSTPECAVTKLMFLVGHGLPNKEIRRLMNSCLAGEITKS